MRRTAEWLLLLLLSAAAADAELVLRGRVVDEAGRPVTGARVELRPEADPYRQGLRRLAGQEPPKPAAAGRSGPRGEFELAAPEIGLWRLTAAAEGRVAMARLFQPLLHGQALSDVRLLPAVSVTVTVTAGGEPVSGVQGAHLSLPAPQVALVEIRTERDFEPWREAWSDGRWWPLRRSAKTGVDGRAELLRAVGEEPEIGVAKTGFRAAVAPLSGAAVAVVLEPGPRDDLRLVDAGGRPAGGVLFLAGRLPLGVTAKDGSLGVTTAGLPPPLRFAVAAAGGAPAYRAPLPVAEEGVVRLPPVLEVRGRVIGGPDGRPIAGALVWLDRGPAVATRTDAQGRFRWLAAESSLRLGFAAPGYRPQRLALGAEAGASEPPASRLEIALEPAAVLAGRVIDEEGQPVAGARVEVRPLSRGDRSWNRRGAVDRAVATAADGGFRLDGLPTGELQQIRVTGESYAPAAATAVADAGSPGPVAWRLEIVLERGAAVSGRVADADGSVISGATVRFSHRPAEGEARLEIRSGELLSAPEAVTGADGRFEVRGLPAGEHAAEVAGQGFATAAVPGIRVGGPPGPDLDLGTITLAAAAAIEVEVTDPGGEPIAGVRISVFPASGAVAFPRQRIHPQIPVFETDDRGRCRYDDLAAGERVSLRLAHPSYVERSVEAVEAPTGEPLAIVLRPGAALDGIVVADGQAVGAASLEARTEVVVENRFRSSTRSFYQPGRSGADGRFALRGVHPGEVRLIVRARGFAEESLSLRLAEGEHREGLRVELRRGASVSGRVLDPRGRPVAGAEVSLSRRLDEHSTTGSGATTDGEGRFRLTNQPPGPVSISAHHPVHGRASLEVDLGPDPSSVELALEAVRAVSGRVVDAGGRPVAGAQIGLSRVSGTSRSTISTGVAGDGSFAFFPEEPGEYRLWAERDDLARTTLPLTVGDEPIAGLELMLREGPAIVGALLGLRPADRTRVAVWAWPTEEGQYRRGAVDHQGNYRISGLMAGRWRLEAAVAGTGRKATAVVRVAEGDVEVVRDLELGNGDLRLTGVVLAAGEPAVGARVSATGPGGTVQGEASFGGRFRLEGLEPGTYRLAFGGDWGTHYQTVQLWSDQEIEVSFELRRVAGRTVAADGQPLAGVAVILVEDAAGRSLPGVQRVSDAEGRFAFPRLPEDRYRLLARKEGFATATVSFEVRGADVEDLEVVLSSGAPLVLELRTASGGPPPGRVWVAALDADDRPVAAVESEAGPDGRLEITAVPPGSWQLVIRTAETVPARRSVEVPGGPYAVVLEPRTELRVLVPALADSSAPAVLWLTDAAGRPFTPRFLGRPGDQWDLRRGMLFLRFLPPGTWELRVEGPAGETWSGVATTRPESPTEVILE